MPNKTKFVIVLLLLVLLLAVISFQFTGFLVEDKCIKGPIKIGVILSNTYLSEYNANIINAIEVTKNHINAQSINGSCLEIVYGYDNYDGTDREAFKTTMENLIADGVKIFLFSKPRTIWCLLELLDQTKFIAFYLIGPGNLDIEANKDYIFQLRDYHLTPAIIMAEVIPDYFNIKEIGILYVNDTLPLDDGYNHAVIFKDVFEGKGGKVVFEDSFFKDQADFTEQIQRLNASGAEGLMIIMAFKKEYYINILREIEKLNMSIKVFLQGSEEPLFLEGFDNVVFPSQITFGGVSRLTGPLSREAHQFIDILNVELDICGDDVECLKKRLHSNEYSGALGSKIRFREGNGLMIRPYIIKTTISGGTVNLFEYSLLE